MKNKILKIILTDALWLLATFGFAEEFLAADNDYKITTGGYFLCTKNLCGGGGELGFRILNEKNLFVLRNSIFLQGGGGTFFTSSSSSENEVLKTVDFGEFEIGDKIIFGGRANCINFIIRSYGFVGFSLGLFFCENHKFFSLPFLLNTSCGGGFEFQYKKDSAFFCEYGIDISFLMKELQDFKVNTNSKFVPVFLIGYRSLL